MIKVIIILIITSYCLCLEYSYYNKLVYINNVTNGENWITKWNVSNLNYCEWYGVKCDYDQVPFELNLVNNNLTNIDSFLINGISSINLSNNNLRGNIFIDANFIHISNNFITGLLDRFFDPNTRHYEQIKNTWSCVLDNNNISYVPKQCIYNLDVSNNNIATYNNNINSSDINYILSHNNYLIVNITFNGNSNLISLDNSYINNLILSSCNYFNIIVLDNVVASHINIYSGNYTIIAKNLTIDALAIMEKNKEIINIEKVNFSNSRINNFTLSLGKFNDILNFTSSNTSIYIRDKIDYVNIGGNIGNFLVYDNRKRESFYSGSNHPGYYSCVQYAGGRPTFNNADVHELENLNIIDLNNKILDIQGTVNNVNIKNLNSNNLTVYSRKLYSNSVSILDSHILNSSLLYIYNLNIAKSELNTSLINSGTFYRNPSYNIYLILSNITFDNIVGNSLLIKGLNNITISDSNITNLSIHFNSNYMICSYSSYSCNRPWQKQNIWLSVSIMNSFFSTLEITDDYDFHNNGGGINTSDYYILKNMNLTLSNITALTIKFYVNLDTANITIINSNIGSIQLSGGYLTIINSNIGSIQLSGGYLTIINSTINNVVLYRCNATIINSTINNVEYSSVSTLLISYSIISLENFIKLCKNSKTIYAKNINLNSSLQIVNEFKNAISITLNFCNLYGVSNNNYSVAFVDLQFNNILFNEIPTDFTLYKSTQNYNHYYPNTLMFKGPIYTQCSDGTIYYGSHYCGYHNEPSHQGYNIVLLSSVINYFYSPTLLITPSHTPSNTPSITSSTPSITPLSTYSITPSITPSSTYSITPSSPPSITSLSTPSITPSSTYSITSLSTPSITPSSTYSITPSNTYSITPSITPSSTPSITSSNTPSIVPSSTPSNPSSITPSSAPSITIVDFPKSQSVTLSISSSITPSLLEFHNKNNYIVNYNYITIFSISVTCTLLFITFIFSIVVRKIIYKKTHSKIIFHEMNNI